MEETQYKTRIESISDNEIKEILRQRDHYNPEAAEAAIEEAIARGIIHQREDLNQKEFEVQPIERRKLFPTPISMEKAETSLNSMTRVLYGLSIVPLIFAILKFAERDYLMVLLSLLLAAGTAYVTYEIKKRKSTKIAQSILILNPILWFVLIQHLIGLGTQTIMDFVVAFVLSFVIFYITMATYKIVSFIETQNR